MRAHYHAAVHDRAVVDNHNATIELDLDCLALLVLPIPGAKRTGAVPAAAPDTAGGAVAAILAICRAIIGLWCSETFVSEIVSHS